MVIEHGVDVDGADPWLTGPASFTRPVGGGRGIASSLLTSEEPVPAAVGDVGELGDVHMDHRPRVGVLVTTQWFPGDPVDVGETVDPVPDQHRVHGRGGRVEVHCDLGWSEASAPPQRHDAAGALV